MAPPPVEVDLRVGQDTIFLVAANPAGVGLSQQLANNSRQPARSGAQGSGSVVNLTNEGFTDRAASLVLIATRRRSEFRVSFRDAFLDDWNASLDAVMGSSTSRTGDPVLDARVFDHCPVWLHRFRPRWVDSTPGASDQDSDMLTDVCGMDGRRHSRVPDRHHESIAGQGPYPSSIVMWPPPGITSCSRPRDSV